MATTMFPALPARASYLTLLNPKRRNALSLDVLRSLRSQLIEHNTSHKSKRLLLLPPFKPHILDKLESSTANASNPASTSPRAIAALEGKHNDDLSLTDEDEDYSWLVDSARWREERAGLPSVIILRSSLGPVFSSGHDLGELAQLRVQGAHAEIKETFALCADVMKLIRRSPAPVVSAVHGLATAAGAQLALCADITVAGAKTSFSLPGAKIGLPCTSPSSVVIRKLGSALTYRMLALAEGVRAEELGGAVDVVPEPPTFEGEDVHELEKARLEILEARVLDVADKLAVQAAQPTALGKWAFWTQSGLGGESGSGGDGLEEAVNWTGRVMALHARGDDAREGMTAFMEKRKPLWVT